MMIFTKISNLSFFIPIIIQILLPGQKTKKKYWPKSPWLKKNPEKAKKCQFWSLFWAFFYPILSLWWPSLGGELRGYSTDFWYVSLQNMKIYDISSPGMRGTPCHHYKSNPLKRSANVPGVVKTQILPNICCQILHLCISYSNKTGFTYCVMVKLKYQQFSTMVWPTSESSRGPETHYLCGF